jgi:hypothetical protein
VPDDAQGVFAAELRHRDLSRFGCLELVACFVNYPAAE